MADLFSLNSVLPPPTPLGPTNTALAAQDDASRISNPLSVPSSANQVKPTNAARAAQHAVNANGDEIVRSKNVAKSADSHDIRNAAARHNLSSSGSSSGLATVAFPLAAAESESVAFGPAGLAVGGVLAAGIGAKAFYDDPQRTSLDQHLAPQPRAGTAPTTSSTSPAGIGVLERQRYPYVDSHSLDAGKAALADFNQCHLDDMKMLPGGKGFQSFTSSEALKTALGNLPIDASGKPYEIHHLVEQNQTSKFGNEAIQNTGNAVPVPSSVHSKISGFYSKSAADAGFQNVDGTAAKGRVRDAVSQLPYKHSGSSGLIRPVAS